MNAGQRSSWSVDGIRQGGGRGGTGHRAVVGQAAAMNATAPTVAHATPPPSTGGGPACRKSSPFRYLGRVVAPKVCRLRGRLAAFADRPDDEGLAAAHVAGGETLSTRGAVALRRRPRRCRAGRASTPSSLSMPCCTGRGSPWRGARGRPGARTRVPGIGLQLVVDARTQSSRLTLPFVAARSRAGRDANSRSAPSSWLDEVRSLIGQFGQVSALFSLLGRHRHDLELGDRERALAEGGADAVGAGVAAADDDDMLAGRRGSARHRPAARRRCGGSAAAGSPWRSGCPAARGPGSAGRAAFSAPPASSTAS